MKKLTRFQLTMMSICLMSLLFGAARACAELKYADEIKKIQETYVPDSRLNLFQERQEDGKTVIATSCKAAYDALVELAKKPDAGFTPALYPEQNPRVGEKCWGLVAQSAIFIRNEPDHPAEMGTQSLMGMPVRVLDAPKDLSDDDPWILIQNQDGYLGFITYGGIARMTKEELDAWKKAPRLVWTRIHGLILAEPKRNAAIVSDVCAGNVFVYLGEEKDGFYKVQLPAGQVGWAHKRACEFFDKWVQDCELTPERIIATAKQFMNVPYLWGGTSAHALDCSGLVSYTLFLNRITALRDVSQQVRDGIEVDVSNGIENIQPGDFLIFGSRRKDGSLSMRHIGIAIGNNEFIHAATNVHISSLDPNAENYDGRNRAALIKAVRYCGAPYSETYKPVKDNPFYK